MSAPIEALIEAKAVLDSNPRKTGTHVYIPTVGWVEIALSQMITLTPELILATAKNRGKKRYQLGRQ